MQLYHSEMKNVTSEGSRCFRCTDSTTSVKKERDVAIIYKKVQRQFRHSFIQEQGNELGEHCMFVENKLFGRKVPELRRLAFQLSVWKDFLNPFQDSVAGKDWFTKHHTQLQPRGSWVNVCSQGGSIRRTNCPKSFICLETSSLSSTFVPVVCSTTMELEYQYFPTIYIK
jgi:hypothetical protein